MVLDDVKRVEFSYDRRGRLKSAKSLGLDPNETGYNSEARFEYNRKGQLIWADDHTNGGYVELELSYDATGRVHEIKTLQRLYKVHYVGNDVSRIERLNPDTRQVVEAMSNVRMDASSSPFYQLPIAVKNYIMLQIGVGFLPNFSSILSEHNVAELDYYQQDKRWGTDSSAYTVVDDKVVRVDVTRIRTDSDFRQTIPMHLQYRCR